MVYAMAAVKRGEQCSTLLFDESVESHIVRSQGLGFDVAAAIKAGRMRVADLDPAELSLGQIAHLLVRQVEEDNVGLVVIDTLNGYLQSAVEEHAVFLQLRELISYLNRRRVVTLLTLTEHGILGSERSTPIDVSFLADNVILLRYFEARGAIRQALSVVKKRTGQHERTIRELIVKPGGISVGEPLENLAAVLTGTPQHLPP
jgi:circadian clock protein KaiC